MATRGPEKQFDRAEALDKAMQVFWRRGYEATGVSELLDGMGIGRQSMYDTFGSKYELFLEALREYGRRELTRMIGVLQAPGSPLANIRGLLEMQELEQKKHPGSGCLMGNTMAELGGRDEDVAAIVRSGLEIIRGALRDTLVRARDAGEIDEDADVEGLANLIVTAVQGTALLTKVHQDQEFSRLALRGLRAVLSGT